MKKILLIFILFSTVVNCSIQRLAIRSMDGVLDNVMNSLYEESDLKLAEPAIASDLKLIEGLIKSDPENERLLMLAAQGFFAFALGFVEDEDPDRARDLHIRGRDYGLQVLKKKKTFNEALIGDVNAFEKSLDSFEKEDVPALFWTANCWAGWINLSFTNTRALADLPRVQSLMRRVIELNEDYFYGSAHLFFGTIYAARPPLLGGDAEKSKYHFDKCLDKADEKFLLPYVYYAKFYATRLFDEALFKTTLEKVINTSGDILPDQRLPNAIAKEKAKKLLSQAEEYF